MANIKYMEWFRLGAVITTFYYLVISVLLVLLFKLAIPNNVFENINVINTIVAALGLTSWFIVGAIFAVGGGLALMIARFIETKLKFKAYKSWKASIIFKVFFIESMIWTILAIPFSIPVAIFIFGFGVIKAIIKAFVNKHLARMIYKQIGWRLPNGA